MLSSCKPRQKRENLNIKLEINQCTIDRVKESMLLSVYTKICYGNRTLLISLGKVLKSSGIIYKAMGPVVQRPISASPGLNFNAGLFIFSKTF